MPYKYCMLLPMIYSIVHSPLLYSNNTSSKCTEFPLTYNALNIPISQIEMAGKKTDVVFDLGMKDALSIEESLVSSISDLIQSTASSNSSDLTGNVVYQKKGIISNILINDIFFESLSFRIENPWGLWVNTDSNKHVLPKNTIGRDLFLKQKGILYYSSYNGILRWCPQGNILEEESNNPIVWSPLIEDEEGIHITAYHNKHKIDLVMDSAATVCIIKEKDWMKLTSEQTTKESDQNKLYNMDNIDFQHGTINITVYPFAFPENFNADGLVGDDFFKQVDLYIDTVNQKIGLKRSTA